MASTNLADVIVPEIFANYLAENSMTSCALLESGVLVPNPLMEAEISTGGNSLTIPFWGDLLSPADPGGVDPNISNDNPALLSTPSPIIAHGQQVRKHFLNNSWGSMSFAGELAGSDPMIRIAERVVAYWNRTYEFRLVQSLIGILLSNVANNASDMVVDISAATSEAPVTINGTAYAAPNFTRNAVIDAASTIGDRQSDFRAIAMHSSVYREASKNNEIEFIRDSDNNIMFATYAGLAVIQDDSLYMPTAGVYLSVIFGPGAVGFATGAPSTGYPVEVWRYPDQGMGGGASVLYTRQNSIIHPLGFNFVGASVAGDSPTSAELALAANWTRTAFQRKTVPLCFLVSK
jgi:hypothetical protein